jgi:hypothetical protein
MIYWFLGNLIASTPWVWTKTACSYKMILDLCTVMEPAIPGLKRLRQEDCEFKSSIDNIVRLCLNLLQKKNSSWTPKMDEHDTGYHSCSFTVSVMVMGEKQLTDRGAKG